jgi:hypothetical protein
MLTGENVVSVYRLTDNRSFEGLDAGLSREIHRRIEFLFSAAATPTLITVPQKLRASFRRSGSRWTVEIPELVDPIDAAAL